MDGQDEMLIKNIELEYDSRNNVKVAPIIRRISDMGLPIKDNLISYYSITDRTFVFVGRESNLEAQTIPREDIDFNQRLTIKCKIQQT
jgi:hypothetical protein